MANYYGNARSNYFTVKDVYAFEEALSEIPGIETIRQGDKFGILVSGDDYGGWPSYMMDEQDN